jgi:hypothetical protein
MMPSQPSQPVVVQQPATQQQQQQQASAPVVTPLGGQPSTTSVAAHGANPVVTPLEAPRAPTPEEVPPTMAQERQQQAAPHRAVKHVAKVESARVASAPRKHAAAAASDDDDDEAPAPARKAAKKESKSGKGADWVDPFAQ